MNEAMVNAKPPPFLLLQSLNPRRNRGGNLAVFSGGQALQIRHHVS